VRQPNFWILVFSYRSRGPLLFRLRGRSSGVSCRSHANIVAATALQTLAAVRAGVHATGNLAGRERR